MKPAPCVVLIALAAGACATASTAHWESSTGGDQDTFRADNERCGAVASRVTPTPRPDLLPAGNVAPRNRMDAPPRQDVNPVRQRAYMDCMADRGWRVVE
jgi:hypothetical protein